VTVKLLSLIFHVVTSYAQVPAGAPPATPAATPGSAAQAEDPKFAAMSADEQVATILEKTKALREPGDRIALLDKFLAQILTYETTNEPRFRGYLRNHFEKLFGLRTQICKGANPVCRNMASFQAALCGNKVPVSEARQLFWASIAESLVKETDSLAMMERVKQCSPTPTLGQLAGVFAILEVANSQKWFSVAQKYIPWIQYNWSATPANMPVALEMVQKELAYNVDDIAADIPRSTDTLRGLSQLSMRWVAQTPGLSPANLDKWTSMVSTMAMIFGQGPLFITMIDRNPQFMKTSRMGTNIGVVSGVCYTNRVRKEPDRCLALVSELKKAIPKNSPDSISAEMLEFDHAYYNSQIDVARKIIAGLIPRAQGDMVTVLHYVGANLDVATGNLDQALNYLAKQVKQNEPENAWRSLFRANIYIEKKRFAEAQGLVDKINTFHQEKFNDVTDLMIFAHLTNVFLAAQKRDMVALEARYKQLVAGVKEVPFFAPLGFLGKCYYSTAKGAYEPKCLETAKKMMGDKNPEILRAERFMAILNKG
jgi:tetratricopeptide (TPR) repeat protein